MRRLCVTVEAVDGVVALRCRGQPPQRLDGPPPWTLELEATSGECIECLVGKDVATASRGEWVVGADDAAATVAVGNALLHLTYRWLEPAVAAPAVIGGYLCLEVTMSNAVDSRLVVALEPCGAAVSVPVSASDGTATLRLPTTDVTLAVASLRFELYAPCGLRPAAVGTLAALPLGVPATVELLGHPQQKTPRHILSVAWVLEPFAQLPVSRWRHVFILEATALPVADGNLVARLALPAPLATAESALALSATGAHWAWHLHARCLATPTPLRLEVVNVATGTDALVAYCDISLEAAVAWLPLSPHGQVLVAVFKEAPTDTIVVSRLCNLPASTQRYEVGFQDAPPTVGPPLVAHCSTATTCAALASSVALFVDEPVLSVQVVVDGELHLRGFLHVPDDIGGRGMRVNLFPRTATAVVLCIGDDAETYTPRSEPSTVCIELVTPATPSLRLTYDGDAHSLVVGSRVVLNVDDTEVAVLMLESEGSRGYIYGVMFGAVGSNSAPWEGVVNLVDLKTGAVALQAFCRIVTQPRNTEDDALFSRVTSPVQYVAGPGTLFVKLVASGSSQCLISAYAPIAAITASIPTAKWSSASPMTGSDLVSGCILQEALNRAQIAVPIHWSPNEKALPVLVLEASGSSPQHVPLPAWLLQPAEWSTCTLPSLQATLTIVYAPNGTAGPPAVRNLPSLSTVSVVVDVLSLEQLPPTVHAASMYLLALPPKPPSMASRVLMQRGNTSSTVLLERADFNASLTFESIAVDANATPMVTINVVDGATQKPLAKAATPLFAYITATGHLGILALPAMAPTLERLGVVNVHLHAIVHPTSTPIIDSHGGDDGVTVTIHDVKNQPLWHQTTVFLCSVGSATEATTTSATKSEPQVCLPRGATSLRLDAYQGSQRVASGTVALQASTRQWVALGSFLVAISIAFTSAPRPVAGKLYLDPLEAKIARSWKNPYLRLSADDRDVYKSSVYKLTDGCPAWSESVVVNVPHLPIAIACSLYSKGALGQSSATAATAATAVTDGLVLDDWLPLEGSVGHVHLKGVFVSKTQGALQVSVLKLVLSADATDAPYTVDVDVPPALLTSPTPLRHRLDGLPSTAVVFHVTNAQAASVLPTVTVSVAQGPLVVATATVGLLDVLRHPVPDTWHPLVHRQTKDNVGAVQVRLAFAPTARPTATPSVATTAALSQWKKLFYMLDTDHSGSISLAEFSATLRTSEALQHALLAPNDTRSVEQQVTALYTALDINGDGEISFDEYVMGMLEHNVTPEVADTPPLHELVATLQARVAQLVAELAAKEAAPLGSEEAVPENNEPETVEPDAVASRTKAARPMYTKHTDWYTTQLALEYDASPLALKEENRQLRAELSQAATAHRLARAHHERRTEKLKRQVHQDRQLAQHPLLHKMPPKGLHDDVVAQGKLVMLEEEVKRLRNLNDHLLRLQLQSPEIAGAGDVALPPAIDPELLGHSAEAAALRSVHNQLYADHADLNERCQRLEDDAVKTQRLLAAQTERCEILQAQLHQATAALQAQQRAKQAQTTRSTVVQSALELELARQARLQDQRAAARLAQTTASILLQSKVRMRLQQKRYQAAKMQRAAAVVLLQSRLRGRLTRVRFRADLRVFRAAVRLQRLVRMFLCRSKFVQLYAARLTAARAVQAQVRRWQAQVQFVHAKLAIGTLPPIASARSWLVLVQAYARRFVAQHRRRRLQGAYRVLRPQLVRHVLRRRAFKAAAAAVTIQRAWRRRVARMDAAVIIQRHARGRGTRRRLQRERTLGAWLHMFVLRRRFWRAKAATRAIQGRWRQWHVFLQETEAALAVQSTYPEPRQPKSKLRGVGGVVDSMCTCRSQRLLA
ncbi:hypothetical protein ACHHYP_12219 [Achlya hypogyna]|uniref:EF-hand domain-containing protein n=1 Tax=Achlya hypogyna TaxID=1202772 RepID=A0A1V9ZH27_ACHHY|nr:hypothetical protein ACHHYP_12219 [Achlya hypogyna]